MRGFLRFFFRDGQTTLIGNIVAQASAWSAIAIVILSGFNNVFGWIVLVASGMVILIFGIAAKAESLGLKPFTNDPLGWRKAKATYQDGEPLPASKPGFIARLFGRK